MRLVSDTPTVWPRNGASLEPPPPVTSKDPNTPYLHIHQDEPIDEAQLEKWLRQASRLPGERMF